MQYKIMPASVVAHNSYPSVVSVVNLKGGVGKTTLAVHLAYGLAFFHGRRVLIVDLDPQANATQYLISQRSYRDVYLAKRPTKLTVVDLYAQTRGEDLSETRKSLQEPERFLQRVYTGSPGHLDLLASKLELSLTGFQEGHGQQHDQIRCLLEDVGDRYDFVFIDCPPTVSRMLMAAFEASQYFLVPVKPEFLSTIGIPLLDKVLKNLYLKKIARRPSYMPASLKPLGIVYTMVNELLNMAQDSIQELDETAKQLKYPIFQTRISSSTKFAWSSRKALPIFRSEPRSKYAVEIENFVAEFAAIFEDK